MTELEMYEAIRPMFPANEYALMPQVRNGTGYQKRTRTADAVAISLWPSRGIDLIGFEFKDTRSDVLKELAESAKSDEIGRYCAFWWLVVSDAKLITLDELPSAWGLISIKDGVAKKTRQAPRRSAEKPDLPLLASIMKAGAGAVTGENDVNRRINAAVKKALDDQHEQFEKRRKTDREAEESNRSDLNAAYVRFRDETGIDILHGGRYGRPLGKAVKFVLDGGLDNLGLIVGWCNRVSEEAKQLLGDQQCHS